MRPRGERFLKRSSVSGTRNLNSENRESCDPCKKESIEHAIAFRVIRGFDRWPISKERLRKQQDLESCVGSGDFSPRPHHVRQSPPSHPADTGAAAAVAGGRRQAGVVLLQQLGNRVNAILRENYDSVIAMERLNEALERIDSSFQFALSGRDQVARDQFEANWRAYFDNLTFEQHNITLPREAALVEELTKLTDSYRIQGLAFFSPTSTSAERETAYYGPAGLLETFKRVKSVSGQILRLNQSNMEQASRDAQQLAFNSLVWFGIGLAVADYSGRAVRLAHDPHDSAADPGDDQRRMGSARAISTRSSRICRATNWASWHRPSTRWPATCATIANRRPPSSCAPSRPARRPSIPFPTRSSSSTRRAVSKWPIPPRGDCWGSFPNRMDRQAAGIWQPPEPLRQPLPKLCATSATIPPEGFDQAILLGVERPRASHCCREF